MLDVVGEHWFLVYKVIIFLHGRMYTWETLYLHYLQNDVMHFDVSHSSAHEGTNHSLKSHSCAIKPIIDLDTLANKLNIQRVADGMTAGTLILTTNGSYDRKQAANLSGVGCIIFCRATRQHITGSFWERSSTASSF